MLHFIVILILLWLKENTMKSDRNVMLDTHDHRGFAKCFSWSAVFAGALVGLGLSFLLNLFGLAIGLTTFTTSPEGMKVLAIGGFLGITLGTIIAMYFAGMATGYLARPFCMRRHLATTYGFTTWSVILLGTIMFATHIGNFVSHTSDMISTHNVIVMTDQPAPASAPTPAPVETVSADKAANTLGGAAFITFFLFLIGAISCCIGAHHGLICCRDDAAEIK
jgi:hypothetical protein